MRTDCFASATFVLAWLGMVCGNLAGAADQAVCIEARFVEHGPGDTVTVLATPRLVTLPGKTAVWRQGEDRSPAGPKPPTEAEIPTEPLLDRMDTGITLTATPALIGDGVILTGRAVIVEILDRVTPTPSGTAAGVACTFCKVVAPFSLVFLPGDEFVTLPMARGEASEKRREVQLRVALQAPPLPPAEPSVHIEARFVERKPDGTVKDMGLMQVAGALTNARGIFSVAESRQFPNGRIREELGETEKPNADELSVGISLGFSAKMLDDDVILVGRVTFTDVLDVVDTAPPNEGEACSYALRAMVIPFSLVVSPGDEFVTLPLGKRRGYEGKMEAQFRVTLTGQ